MCFYVGGISAVAPPIRCRTVKLVAGFVRGLCDLSQYTEPQRLPKEAWVMFKGSLTFF